MTQLTEKAIWINPAKLKIHWPYHPLIPVEEHPPRVGSSEALAHMHKKAGAKMFLAMWTGLNSVPLKLISSPEPQNVALFGNKVVENIVI